MNRPKIIESIFWWLVFFSILIFLGSIFVTLRNAVCFGTEKTIEDILKVEQTKPMPDYICHVVMGR